MGKLLAPEGGRGRARTQTVAEHGVCRLRKQDQGRPAEGRHNGWGRELSEEEVLEY